MDSQNIFGNSGFSTIGASNPLGNGGFDVVPQTQPVSNQITSTQNDALSFISRLKRIPQNVGASFQDPNNPVAGFIKGAGTFLSGFGLSPDQLIGKTQAASTVNELKPANEKLSSSLKTYQDVTDRLIAASHEVKDPAKRQALLDLAAQGTHMISTLNETSNGNTTKLSDLLKGKIPEQLQPLGKGQEIGYAGEKLGEFMLPSGFINKANVAINAATKELPGLAKFLVRTAARGSAEAGSAITVGKSQGATDEQAANYGKVAFGVTAGLSALAEGGSFLIDKARRIYSSAAKFSTAGQGGSARAAANVETGLREGVTLTERGTQKTASVIDNLETQLGDAIDKAAGITRDGNGAILSKTGTGATIPTQSLKPFVEDAKAILGNTVDTEGSKRAVQTINDMYDSFVKQYGENLPVEVAQELKKNTYQVLKNSYGELANATREGMKAITRGLKEGIVGVAPTVGDINPRLGALYNFDKALEKSMGRIKNLNLLGLGTKVVGAGVGGKAGVVLGALNEFIGAPGVKSFSAVKLYQLGNFLEKLGPEEAQAVAFQGGSQLSELWARFTGKGTALSAEEKAGLAKIKSFIDGLKDEPAGSTIGKAKLSTLGKLAIGTGLGITALTIKALVNSLPDKSSEYNNAINDMKKNINSAKTQEQLNVLGQIIDSIPDGDLKDELRAMRYQKGDSLPK